MRRSELFRKILEAVSSETEIPIETIMSNDKHSEVVDARCIIVRLMYDSGCYTSQIARLMGKTGACVRSLMCSFDGRNENNKMIKRITNKLRKSFETD